ncbi:MAG: hypothetical protein NZ870_04200, partial [bacterium]|nr:hypothetical protein [bacterium]
MGERKITRREALNYLLYGTIGLGVGFGLAQLKPREKIIRETVTETKFKTITDTLTSTETKISTITKTLTETKTVTETITKYAPVAEEVIFHKHYSPTGLNLSYGLKFGQRVEVKDAELNFIYPYEIQLPLKKADKNIFVGQINIEKPKPVIHVGVWDAKSVDNVAASMVLPLEKRKIEMKMPLEREEYERIKQLVDW